MAIITEADRQLAEIADLAGVVMARLKAYHHSHAATDPQEIRRAVQQYADAVIEFINFADHR